MTTSGPTNMASMRSNIYQLPGGEMCKETSSNQQTPIFKNNESHERSTKIIFSPNWAISLVAVLFAGSVCYKIIDTDFRMVFDFSSFLSLILALFSIFLAALFYFKATDTSNAFYDNTYKFTQEMAQLLSKIESGFGEKLTHLDASYKGMMDRIDKFPPQTIKETEDKIESKEESIQKLRKDMDAMFHGIFEKAGLGEEEKDSFLQKIRAKERALAKAESTIKMLQHRLSCERNSQSSQSPRAATSFLTTWIKKRYQNLPEDVVLEEVIDDLPKMPHGLLNDLTDAGVLQDGSKLTVEGEQYFKDLIAKVC
ncbi:MAG: hypothetical protein AB7D37_12720 [Desulfovibrio sp.]